MRPLMALPENSELRHLGPQLPAHQSSNDF